MSDHGGKYRIGIFVQTIRSYRNGDITDSFIGKMHKKKRWDQKHISYIGDCSAGDSDTAFAGKLRMIGTFHALSEPTAGERQLVGSLRPNYLFINMLKNFAHNWPNIYLYDSEEWMAKIVSVVARLCKVDIDADKHSRRWYELYDE